ncbi:MAG: glucose-6-phosphate isomerase [Desulfobacterales bacterium]|nr:glucose-6-phosphate isomerase [Desulfobacterales bacterium]
MECRPSARPPRWDVLQSLARVMETPEKHLVSLLSDPSRLERFSLSGGGLFYDYSRQGVDDKVMVTLTELAGDLKLVARFQEMMAGATVNVTEKRAALHTAARRFEPGPVNVDGRDIMADIGRVRREVEDFCRKVENGEICGSTGKPFAHVVVVGIGGSYLGTEFVARALAARADKGITLHFLSNVDIDNFGAVVNAIDPEATLWIIISKSYTTAETMANARQAERYMADRGLDPSRHMAAVTSQGSPGDRTDRPLLGVFHMFDFIGGRYSVSSAVGALPLGLYLGYDRFEMFLRGAEAMDRHAAGSSARDNLPLVAALISVWNNTFLGYPAQAIIPYASPLAKLAPHIQQLNMESNGKSVTVDGVPLEIPAGPIIFGEPGTNAQHSFFQLAHQGRSFPIDFIGVIRPDHERFAETSRGVTNHQELWANLIAQPAALAAGSTDNDPARAFSGNRPSSTLILPDLSPESIGRLLAFYEAKTVFEAFVWDINPFDQFGVELGKRLAATVRDRMAARNRDLSAAMDDDADPWTRFYLEMLFTGKMP